MPPREDTGVGVLHGHRCQSGQKEKNGGGKETYEKRQRLANLLELPPAVKLVPEQHSEVKPPHGERGIALPPRVPLPPVPSSSSPARRPNANLYHRPIPHHNPRDLQRARPMQRNHKHDRKRSGEPRASKGGGGGGEEGAEETGEEDVRKGEEEEEGEVGAEEGVLRVG